MISGLRPYPSYKDSGLSWVPRIPAHWTIGRNGRLFTQRNQIGFNDLPLLEVSISTGVRVREFDSISARKQRMSDSAKYKRAVRGDIAYNMMRMWQGAVGVAPATGLVSPAYVVARPFASTNAEYLVHLFRTDAYRQQINDASRGIVPDRNRLYWVDFKQLPSLLPPEGEQGDIVRCLTWAASKIERAIRAKRQVITLLNELKQAVMHRVLTRGLDSEVSFRPSGVPWLGEVPSHWETVGLGRLCSARCDGPFGSGLKSIHYGASGVRVVRLQNIGSATFREGEPAFISHRHYATLGDHDVIAGDLLVAGLGDGRVPAGRACVAPHGIEPAMVKADCFRFRLKPGRAIPEFLALHLSATAQAATACLSSGATRLRINLSTTAARTVALPSMEEQHKILSYIVAETAPIESSIHSLNREIRLLRDYRTRLISDLVTGKLDVREAAANLPDEAPPEISEPDIDLTDESEAEEAVA